MATKTPIVWKMNGKEFTGRLGVNEIIQVEQELGAGLAKITDKMGMGSTRMILQKAASRLNQNLKVKDFFKDFEDEVEENGLEGLILVSMDILKASGALGKNEEEEKKSGEE